MQASEKKMPQAKVVANIAILAAMLLALVAPAGAQTWQPLGKSATIPVVVENTACNSSTDTVGINAERTLLLYCQSGFWRKAVAYADTIDPITGHQLNTCSLSGAMVASFKRIGGVVYARIQNYPDGSDTGWVTPAATFVINSIPYEASQHAGNVYKLWRPLSQAYYCYAYVP